MSNSIATERVVMTKAELLSQATERKIIEPEMQINDEDIPWIRTALAAILEAEITLSDEVQPPTPSHRAPVTKNRPQDLGM